MLMTDFVHLHVHSDFSLLDAAVSVTSLADRAEELGMTHLAITDHGNMFGVMEFMEACKETVIEKANGDKEHQPRKNTIRPILGCEVYVSPGSRFDKKGAESDDKYHHLILLVMNREGYLNLVKLCSFAYTEGFYYRPRIDEELLARYHGGLIALSACVSGEIPRLIQAGKPGEAESKARYYRDLFGTDGKGNPNFYLEIQDHGITADWLRGNLSQAEINEALIGIARRTGIPLVATNDVHYLGREDSVTHDILLCIGTGKVRTEEKRKKYYGSEFYFKTGDEMAALFPDYPEAIANTVRIAERCAADIPRVKSKDLPKYLPDFKIPEGYENAGSYLTHLSFEGLGKRYPGEKEAGGKPWEDLVKRTEYELNLIIQMGFAGYFLIVADFIKWAQDHGIPVGLGRGSGVASVVAYSLHITGVDPIKHKLIFERFLNSERISMPDFDVDFTNEGRDDVIRYVTEKYSRERVGQIITFGTLGAKAVIKDVARVLGISIPESEMITKLIPKNPAITLSKAINGEPKLRELEQDAKYAELFSIARKLEGLRRHSSIHASGVVIGKSSLYDFVPLYKDPKTGIIATQYDMTYLETCGLVKMDFLGLKTLDLIHHAEELIRLRGGESADFNIENIPEYDEATFRMLGEGKSFAVFQFESDGMQDILRRTKPGSIDDLTALNSLYRPGPMDNISQFIDSKNGRQAISYPDPSLEDVLKETYGVIVYQEQVMQVARIIAGYSLGQADLLRRAMGKKIKEILDKEKIPFLEGAVKQGYTREKADEIFELLIPFAGYGFNKSHAAAYAGLAYRTAYLKTNFPAEFMAANLTNEIHSADKDKLSECIAEARKMGLVVDPPDINRSGRLFTVVEGRIVFGLLGIKGLGAGPANEIVNCRQEGPYRDFMDFLDRVDIKAVGKSVIERLIQTGAFDQFGKSRGTLLGNLERAVEYAQNIKDDKKFGQGSLFGEAGEKEYLDFEFNLFPEESRTAQLRGEKELIGFYISGHPLDEYRTLWEKLVSADLGRPETLVTGSQMLIGLIRNVRSIITGKGSRMAYAVLEDFNGEIELTFFPGVWEKCQNKLSSAVPGIPAGANGRSSPPEKDQEKTWVDKVVFLRGKIEYRKEKDKHGFIVEEYLEADDTEKIIREEDARAHKWEKYRNIKIFAKELDLQFWVPGAQAKPEPGTYVVIGVLLSVRTTLEKKSQKEMAFGTLRTEGGDVDLLFFARTWENCRAAVSVDEILAFRGTVESSRDKDPGKQTFLVSSMLDLSRLVRSAAKKAAEREKMIADQENGLSPVDSKPVPAYRAVHIRLDPAAVDNEELLRSLRDCLVGNPGQCPVYIHVPAAPRETISPETVIRTVNQINSDVPGSLDTLTKCAAVAVVWGVEYNAG